jgi:hypothetical protein
MSPTSSPFAVASALAAAAALSVTLLAPPATAEDNGLEDPNGCGGLFGDVGQGTVVVLPGGVQPSPTTAAPMRLDPVTGRPLNNIYVCQGGQWVLVASVRETSLSVAADTGSVSVPEGTTATMTGTYQYAGDDPVVLDASFGVLTDHGDGTWTWSTRADDGPATYPVTITATAGQQQAFATFDVAVANVAPTITSLTPSTPVVLVGQPVTFSGTATDPSSADSSAGFSWSTASPTTFDTCGTHTVSATATDKDGGVSAPAASGAVTVLDAAVASPLTAGARNLVRGGQVVPVRLTAGCGGAGVAGLSPTVALVQGDVDPATSSDDPALVVPAADASGDTGGVMRATGGAYLYNLRVPSGAAGSVFTIRVRPAAGSGPLDVVLQLR